MPYKDPKMRARHDRERYQNDTKFREAENARLRKYKRNRYQNF